MFKRCLRRVLALVEAASQMTVSALSLVRAEPKHRNATKAETTVLSEHPNVSHYPGPVAIRFDSEGCIVSREGTQLLTTPSTNWVMWKGLSKLGKDLPRNFMRFILS